IQFQADSKTFSAVKDTEEIDKAFKAFRERNYDQCLKGLEAVVKKRADLSPARILLAALFLQNSQIDNGRAAAEQAIAEDPGHPDGYLLLGKLALHERRTTDAGLQFEKAATLAQRARWHQ